MAAFTARIEKCRACMWRAMHCANGLFLVVFWIADLQCLGTHCCSFFKRLFSKCLYLHVSSESSPVLPSTTQQNFTNLQVHLTHRLSLSRTVCMERHITWAHLTKSTLVCRVEVQTLLSVTLRHLLAHNCWEKCSEIWATEQKNWCKIVFSFARTYEKGLQASVGGEQATEWGSEASESKHWKQN